MSSDILLFGLLHPLFEGLRLVFLRDFNTFMGSGISLFLCSVIYEPAEVVIPSLVRFQYQNVMLRSVVM